VEHERAQVRGAEPEEGGDEVVEYEQKEAAVSAFGIRYFWKNLTLALMNVARRRAREMIPRSISRVHSNVMAAPPNLTTLLWIPGRCTATDGSATMLTGGPTHGTAHVHRQAEHPRAARAARGAVRNLWISWNYEAILLFMRLDHDAWLASRQSPTRMLGLVSQKRLDEAAADDSFLAALSIVHAKFKRYLAAERWYKGPTDAAIAYFSMEYGIDVSLPVYSGGLGVLSGDHLKSASDLGLPLVGVGLLYRQGYFQQYLNADGFQQESYPENDWYNMPVSALPGREGRAGHRERRPRGRKGERLGVGGARREEPAVPSRHEHRGQPRPLRQITASLYGGDRENRIRQEILLGVGGIRALNALGITPAVTHVNEGTARSSASSASRPREGSKLSFAEALQAVWAPACSPRTRPCRPATSGSRRRSWRSTSDPWRRSSASPGRTFSPSPRARRRRHRRVLPHRARAAPLRERERREPAAREVSRGMWRRLWPGLPLAEVPIGHVTNGVHPRTWIATTSWTCSTATSAPASTTSRPTSPSGTGSTG